MSEALHILCGELWVAKQNAQIHFLHRDGEYQKSLRRKKKARSREV